MKSETLLINSKDTKLYTTIVPKQNAETVIFLHGGPGVPMDYSPISDKLLNKYQVITFDQRGTGRSPTNSSSYFIDEYLDDINAIASHFNVEKFHIFGHSWGGLYAQIYAEKYPEKILSLYLLSPSSGTGEHWKQTEREVLAFNKRCAGSWGWFKMGLNSLLGMLGSHSAYQSLFKQVLKNYNQGFDLTFPVTDKMVENVRSEPINKTRSNIIRYPILEDSKVQKFRISLAYGDNDIYGVSKEHVTKRYPHADLLIFKNAGHIAWVQNPGKFNESLSEFYGI